jgi:MATE family multidrug resistance protein
MPAFGSGVLESSLFGVVTILAGRFGVEVLAATTIAIYLSDLFIVPALGVGDVLMIRVAAEAATGGARAGARIALRGLLLVAALTLPWVAACLWVPDLLVAAFLDPATEDTAVVEGLCRSFLAVAAWALLADAAQIAISRSLKGLRDTLVPMWIAAVGYWALGVGGGWLLAKNIGLGGIGLWYGLAGGLGLTALALMLRMGLVCASDGDRLSRRPRSL